MATEPRPGRRWVRNLALAGISILGQPALAQPPAAPRPAAGTAAATDPGQAPVAYIHGTTVVTRADLGEFLIARGGMDKIDLLVNRRVIEIEAARRGVTVTTHEVEAGLNQDLAGAGVEKAVFVQFVRERYGKSLFEWEHDVIRPRLLLGKIGRDRVKVTPEEVQAAFESKYGEKREARVVIWPKGADIPQLGQDVKDTARANPAEFEKLAAGQPNKRFADARGKLDPVGRHLEGIDPRVEAALFALKENETSQWIETADSWTCIRLLKIVPPDPANTFEARRAEVEKEVFDRKLAAENPVLFEHLRATADPVLTTQVPPRPQADPKAPPAPRVQHPDPRVLAVVHYEGRDLPITRADLGEFLIARGGAEKLELLVNKKIVEREVARRGLTLTPEEVEAAKKDYLAKLGVPWEDFTKQLLPKQGLTPETWTEDVIKAELLMTKMCADRVKVTPEEVQKAFENRFGEKRRAKIILWRKEEARTAPRQWDEARKGDEEFDRVARAQSDRELASRCGEVAPIGRHLDADNPLIERVVFTLREGEVSQLFDTPAGIICVKYVGKVPAQAGVTLDTVRAALEKEVYERKLMKEIPALFAELKKAADPNLLLRGAPSQQEFEEGTRHLLQQLGGPKPTK